MKSILCVALAVLAAATPIVVRNDAARKFPLAKSGTIESGDIQDHLQCYRSGPQPTISGLFEQSTLVFLAAN